MIARALIMLSAAFVIYLCAYFVFQQSSLPIVHVSAETRECVAVIGGGSCTELPEFYTRNWVE